MSLPPLPEYPFSITNLVLNNDQCVDLEEWAIAYGRACREAALDEAARVCDTEGEKWLDHTSQLVGYHCAAAIRALKEKP